MKNFPHDERAFCYNRDMDFYAGDAAWFEWFSICSVDGCSAAHRERLRTEVTSAMLAQFGRQSMP